MGDGELLFLCFVVLPIVTLIIIFIGIEFGHGFGGGHVPDKQRFDPEQAYLEQKSFHQAVMEQMRYNSLPDQHGIEELGQSIGGITHEMGNLIDCFTD